MGFNSRRKEEEHPMTHNPRICGPVGAMACMLAAHATADNLIYKDANGRIVVTPAFSDPAFNNTTWNSDLESGFIDRYNAIIAKQLAKASPTNFGTTFFESEKSGYPYAMAVYVNAIANNNATHLTAARNFLQGSDAGPDTGYTSAPNPNDPTKRINVDLYASFTLKGQVPKYFYFGRYGNASSSTPGNYLQTSHLDSVMIPAIKSWLAAGDPLTAAHPNYPTGPTETGGYTPANTGKRVDTRATDNLKAMREVAVYLFANEVYNVETDPTAKANYQSVRDLYAQRYQEGTVALMRTGISEFDSGNYMSWSTGTHLSMYDFAPNTPQGNKLRKQAKANVDINLAGAALKYWRGGYGAPMLRDYGGTNVPMGNDTARHMSLFVGGSVVGQDPIIQNDVHAMLSSYRPSKAIVDLAAKNHAKDLEIFSTKPAYGNWKSPEQTVAHYYETDFYGDNYQFGTLSTRDTVANPHSAPWNLQRFKIATFSTARGVDYFGAGSSTQNGQIAHKMRDQIGQYRNQAIWIRPNDGSEFYFLTPDPTKAAGGQGDMTVDGGVYFFEYEKSWVAMRPINLTYDTAAGFASGVNINEIEHNFNPVNPGSGYAGFAVEVGEPGAFADYAAFRASVLSRPLDLTNLAGGVVGMTGHDGRSLSVGYNPAIDLPVVKRDGVLYDYNDPKNQALYRSITGQATATLAGVVDGQEVTPGQPLGLTSVATAPDRGPIDMGWQTGTMTLLTGTRDTPGTLFIESIDADGNVTWTDRAATAADFDGQIVLAELLINGVVAATDANPADGITFEWAVPNVLGAGPINYALQTRVTDHNGEYGLSAITNVSTAIPEPGAMVIGIFAIPQMYRRRRS